MDASLGLEVVAPRFDQEPPRCLGVCQVAAQPRTLRLLKIDHARAVMVRRQIKRLQGVRVTREEVRILRQVIENGAIAAGDRGRCRGLRRLA